MDRIEQKVQALEAFITGGQVYSGVFGRAGRNNALMLEQADYRKMLNFIARQRTLHKDVKVNLSEEGYWGPEWECVVRDEFHYCGSGTQIGSILRDGSITGCPSVSRKFIEGNVSESSFLDVWTKRFSRYRQDRKKRFPENARLVSTGSFAKGVVSTCWTKTVHQMSFCCLDKMSEEGPDRE